MSFSPEQGLPEPTPDALDFARPFNGTPSTLTPNEILAAAKSFKARVGELLLYNMSAVTITDLDTMEPGNPNQLIAEADNEVGSVLAELALIRHTDSSGDYAIWATSGCVGQNDRIGHEITVQQKPYTADTRKIRYQLLNSEAQVIRTDTLLPLSDQYRHKILQDALESNQQDDQENLQFAAQTGLNHQPVGKRELQGLFSFIASAHIDPYPTDTWE